LISFFVFVTLEPAPNLLLLITIFPLLVLPIFQSQKLFFKALQFFTSASPPLPHWFSILSLDSVSFFFDSALLSKRTLNFDIPQSFPQVHPLLLPSDQTFLAVHTIIFLLELLISDFQHKPEKTLTFFTSSFRLLRYFLDDCALISPFL
jgi:hypothetical protein